MTADIIQWAVQDYLEREKKANATPQGADHAALIRKVADDNDLTYGELRNAILDATNMSGVM